MNRGWFLRCYVVALIAFLFLPVVTIVFFSFEEVGLASFPVEGMTLQWYEGLADNEAFLEAAQNSLLLAGICTVVSLAAGTSAAFGLSRLNVRWARGAIIALLVTPILLPGLLLGVALLSFLNFLDIRLSVATAAIGHILLTLPVVTMIMSARLQTYDRSIDDAARVLGASPVRTFWLVTFPLIRPSVIGSGLIAIALSLEEFVVTFFILGSGNTLPIVIWSQMRTGVSPEVNAISAVMLLATLTLILFVRRFTDVTFK